MVVMMIGGCWWGGGGGVGQMSSFSFTGDLELEHHDNFLFLSFQQTS